MSAFPAPHDRGEWRSHWTMLVPCIFGIMLSAVNSYMTGVMIGPLESEFGWSRAEISSGPTIVAMVAVFVAPFVGVGVDRFGPRRIALIGVVLFCAALAMLSTATESLTRWWGLWLMMGIVGMFIMPTVWTAAINGFFIRNRGKALAIALTGTGITAAVVPSMANLLIESYGWRGAYLGIAAIFAALVLPLTWFLFHSVTDRRAMSKAALPPAAALSGMSPREGLRAPSFIKLALAAGIFSVAICALTSNAVPVLIGEGLDRTGAAATAGLIGIGSIIGRLGGGVLLDRFDAGRIAALSVTAPVIALLILLATQDSVTAAGVACFIVGLSVGTEVDACAYLAARHFGLRSFGTLFGTINGVLLLGTGIAPLLANSVYDAVKSYDPVLWVVVAGCLASAALFLMLGAYPQFDRQNEPETNPQPAS